MPSPLTGQPNFRDLGGIATLDGGRTLPGTIYRSGELSHLTDADVDHLAGLGIRTVIDLRSHREVDANGADRLPGGAELVHLPISVADDLIDQMTAGLDAWSPTRSVEVMHDIYRTLVSQWLPTFRLVVDAMVDAPAPLVVHCTHGKDRAGFAAALALLAAGCGWSEIEQDYLASNQLRAAEIERQLARIGSFTTGSSDPNDAGPDPMWFRGLLQVDPTYLETARVEALHLYGTDERLLEVGLGLDGSRLDRFRTRFAEPARPA